MNPSINSKDLFDFLEKNPSYDFGMGIRIVKYDSLIKVFIGEEADYECIYTQVALEELLIYLRDCYSLTK